MEQQARYKNHLTFLIRCREHGIALKGLEVKLPVRSLNKKRLKLIVERTRQALLWLVIKDDRKLKVKIEKQINTCTESLHNMTDEIQFAKIKAWCCEREETKFLAVREIQKHKFEQLLQLTI